MVKSVRWKNICLPLLRTDDGRIFCIGYRSLLVLMLAFWGGRPLVAQVGDVAHVIVVGVVDADSFPEVVVSIRPLDLFNRVVEPSPEQLSLFDNGEEVTRFDISEGERIPVQTVFVIDRGRYFNPQFLQGGILSDVISDFVLGEGTEFRDGIDGVAIVVRENEENDQTRTVLPLTTSRSAFLTAVNRINFQNGRGQTDGLAGIEDGFAQFEGGVGEANRVIIYIGSLIDDPNGWNEAAAQRARPLAALAQEQFVTIHAIHTERDGAYAEPFQFLTDLTGGNYLAIGSSDVGRSVVHKIYEEIWAESQGYKLTYFGDHRGVDERDVVIVPRGVALERAPNFSKGTYELFPRPPDVTLLSFVDDGVVDRQDEWDESGQSMYGVGEVEVVAQLNWLDYEPRQVVEAILWVDGSPHFYTEPSVVGGRLVLPWDVSGYDKGETAEVVEIMVQVIDELGLEGVSSAVQVTLNHSFSPLRSGNEMFEATDEDVIQRGGRGFCTAGWITDDCFWWLLPWAMILLLIIAGGVLLILIFHYRKRVSQMIQRPLDVVRQTVVGGGGFSGRQVIAKIQIERGGKLMMGETIDMYTHKITFGRNPKLCDVQLYDEDCASTVSGLHCTIQLAGGRDRFVVLDDYSANGTYLNGQLLQPARPYPIGQDDILVLGDLVRQGAKLRFDLAADNGAVSESSRKSERIDADQPFDVGATEIFINNGDLVPEPMKHRLESACGEGNNSDSRLDDEDDTWLDEL